MTRQDMALRRLPALALVLALMMCGAAAGGSPSPLGKTGDNRQNLNLW